MSRTRSSYLAGIDHRYAPPLGRERGLEMLDSEASQSVSVFDHDGCSAWVGKDPRELATPPIHP